MSQWTEYAKKFDGMSQREKVMAMAAGFVVIIMVGFTYGIEPLAKANSKLSVEAVSLERQISSLEQQVQAYSIALQDDPDKEVKAQLSQLEKRLQQVEAEFVEEVDKLVSPSSMPALMAEVLGLSKSLELIDVQALAPQSALTVNEDNQDAQPATLYQHGVRMVFKGNFTDSQEFLNALEQTQWQVYWNVMTYNVEQHPSAELTIEFYTLSTEKVFIRV